MMDWTNEEAINTDGGFLNTSSRYPIAEKNGKKILSNNIHWSLTIEWCHEYRRVERSLVIVISQHDLIIRIYCQNLYIFSTISWWFKAAIFLMWLLTAALTVCCNFIIYLKHGHVHARDTLRRLKLDRLITQSRMYLGDFLKPSFCCFFLTWSDIISDRVFSDCKRQLDLKEAPTGAGFNNMLQTQHKKFFKHLVRSS